MVPFDLLRRVVVVLDQLGIRYMVTGSVATTTYGDPRFTNDVDIVVELHTKDADALGAAFPPPDYYCSKDAIVQAIERHFQFNILAIKSGMKVDVIVADDSEFNQSRFARRLKVPGRDNSEVWFASPEDVIIKKMEYFKEGQSDKHTRDILGVLRIRGDKVDRAYIEIWAERLDLSEVWQAILRRAKESTSQ